MIYILLLIALNSFITGQLLRFPLANGLVLQVTDMLVFLTVIVWSGRELYNKRFLQHFRHPYTKPILLFVVIGVVSLLANLTWLSPIQIVISSMYLIRWALYAGVFYVVKGLSIERKKTVFTALIISSVIILLLGYLQYIFYPNLKGLYFLGWDDHLFRMVSTIMDPNYAAAIFTLISLLSLGYLFNRKRLIDKSFYGASALFIFSFIALLLTYSRGGFLTFAGGTIAMFLLLKKRIYLFCFLTLLLIGILIIPKNLHSEGVELWRTASIFSRTESASQAIKMFTDHPLLGIGFDSYRYAQKAYHFAYGKNWEVSHSGGGTDNSLLFVLATTGMAGLAVYLYFGRVLIGHIYAVYKIGNNVSRTKTLSVIILASLVAMVINSFFINRLFYTQILFWMWILLGLIEHT